MNYLDAKILARPFEDEMFLKHIFNPVLKKSSFVAKKTSFVAKPSFYAT